MKIALDIEEEDIERIVRAITNTPTRALGILRTPGTSESPRPWIFGMGLSV
jgi:hypothetical protein